MTVSHSLLYFGSHKLLPCSVFCFVFDNYLKNYSSEGVITKYPLIKPVIKPTMTEEKLDTSDPESSTKSHFCLRLKAVSVY